MPRLKGRFLVVPHDEWWTFTCKDFRCDYQMYAGQPPADFKKLWDKGRKL
jgi:hypothetical protein